MDASSYWQLKTELAGKNVTDTFFRQQQLRVFEGKLLDLARNSPDNGFRIKISNFLQDTKSGDPRALETFTKDTQRSRRDWWNCLCC